MVYPPLAYPALIAMISVGILPVIFRQREPNGPTLRLGHLAEVKRVWHPVLHGLYEGVRAEKDLPLEGIPGRRLPHTCGDEGAATINGLRFRPAESREGRAPLQPLSGRFLADHGPIAARGVIPRGWDHLRTKRVENDVTHKFQKIGFLLNQNRFVPPLKDVPTRWWARLNRLRVNAVKLPHRLCKIPVRRLNQEMVMWLVIRQ